MSTDANPPLSSAVFYRDPMAALEWLEHAFGFDRSMVITAPDGGAVHIEMRHGGGRLMIGSRWADHIASPADVDGKNTQSVHVQLDQDLDAHCERARGAGAAIVQEPENQFYGDRTYRARDPEGHVWTFSQNFAPFSLEESEKATGLKIVLYP